MVERLTATDGLDLDLWRTLPKGLPRGSVLMLHGIQSHAGWYEATRNALAEAGWEVGFLDRRGSGRQTEGRGDAPSWQQLVSDVGVALENLIARPRVLAGISWGAKTALGAAHAHPERVDGLVLLAPGLCPLVTLPLGKRLQILFTRLGSPKALFDIPLNDPALFTDNPRWLAFLAQDPLSLHQATARFLLESTRLDAWLASLRWTVPTLVQLAGRERIIDNIATRRWVRSRLRGPRKIVEYPRAFHTLEFESDDLWRGDLLSWMNALPKNKNPPIYWPGTENAS